VCSQILFPIFNILRAGAGAGAGDRNANGARSTDHNANANGNISISGPRFKSTEDMSVWLSTTLISALRDMIDLYTFYFGVMQLYLDGLLDILVACICQGE
jgi:hypothetical protein